MSEEIEYEEFEVEKVGLEHIGLEFFDHNRDEWRTVEGIGKMGFFYYNGAAFINRIWDRPIRLRRPKPMQKMQKVALGAVRDPGRIWQITTGLYSSLEELKKEADDWAEYYWPVKFDENGFAELPE